MTASATGVKAAAERLEQVGDGLHRFDTHYIRPRHTACFVVAQRGRAAIVDCGVAANVQPLLAAVESLGIARDAIEAIVATHAHLDHAGGAGALIQALPRAWLYAHPSAARHLVDPTRLEQGVRAVYGDEFFEREYGTLVPVPADRAVETPDASVVTVGARELQILHTPGHAWHHQSVHDPHNDTLLAGDAFGVGYPELSGDAGPFFVPETPPNQFDPDAMHASIGRILELGTARVAPTHFEIIDDPPAIAHALHTMVDAYVETCLAAESVEELEERVLGLYAQALERRDQATAVPLMRELYALDAHLVALGLWHWRNKREAST